MKKIKLILLALVLSFSTVFSQVVHIPDDFSSIQAGIDAASDGDTVLVDEGTWYENINFRGKGITVASHYLLEKDSAYIFNTIIDGSQPQPGDSGCVVLFESGEDTTSILCGFTITGGTGCYWPSDSNSLVVKLKCGGGINMVESGGTIIHNIIRDNHVTNEFEAFGGGIQGAILPDNNMIIVEENLVYNNSVNGKVWVKGGGVCIAWCHTRIRNNIIKHNIVTGDSDDSTVYFSAGGLWYSEMNPYLARAIIEGNEITGNEVHALCDVPAGTHGGGMAVFGTPGQLYAKVSGNTIRDNKIFAVGTAFGNGLIVLYADSIDISENIIYNNTDSSSSSRGGGLCVWNSYPYVSVEGNLIYNNSASRGGGIYVGQQYTSKVQFNRNTIFGNQAFIKGGGMFFHNSESSIINSIIWRNIADVSGQIHEENGNVLSVDYSDIEGGWPTGTWNIDSLPIFEDTLAFDFHLMFNSPCIDAGHPDFFDPDGSIVDMGSYYFDKQPVLIDSVSSITDTSFMISWAACEGAVGYMVDLSYDPQFNNYVDAYHNYDVGDTTSFEFTGLTSGTHYTRLRANYFMGRSGYSDTAVILLDNTEEEIIPEINIHVFPNPFEYSVNVRFNLSEKSVINTSIYNVVGERVFTIPGKEYCNGEHTVNINLSGLPAGVYFLQILGENGTVTKKIIKRK